MWDFLGDLIQAVACIWPADSELLDGSPMTAGSEFDKKSRKFTAHLCGGVILFLLIADLSWWYLRK